MDSTQNTQRQNEDRPTPVQFEDIHGTPLGESVILTPGVIGPVLSNLTGGVGNTATLNLTGVTQEASIDSLTFGGITITLTFSDSSTLVIPLTPANIIAAADTAAVGGQTSAIFPLTGTEIDWPSVSGKIIASSQVQCTSDFSSSAGTLRLIDPLPSNLIATITIDTVDYTLGMALLQNGSGGGQSPAALLTEVAVPVITLNLQLYTTRTETLVVDLSAANIQSFADGPTLGAQSGSVPMLLDALLATLPPKVSFQPWLVDSVDYHFVTFYGPDTLAETSALDVHLLSHTIGIEDEIVSIELTPFVGGNGNTPTGGLAVANGDAINILFTLLPVTSVGMLECYTVPQPLNNRSLHAVQFFADPSDEVDYSQPSYDVEYSLDGIHWQIAYTALSMLGLLPGNGVPFRGDTIEPTLYYSALFSPGLPGLITDLPSPTAEGFLCVKYVRYHLYIGEEADAPTPPITALQMAREG